MIGPSPVYPPEPEGRIIPHYSEAGPFVFCFGCHGYLVGPEGQRLCDCNEPAPLPPHLAEKARVLAGMRDALAETYRRRLFRILMPLLTDVTEEEARAAWDGLFPASRERATRKLAERGLS